MPCTRLAIIASMLVLVAGCGRDEISPTTPTVPPFVGPASLRIEGTRPLTALGETVQLGAAYTASDGTVQQVAAEAGWSSSDASIVSVSAAGLLTVERFGAAAITASYRDTRASVSVRPTPPGTFVIAGTVREPGSGIIGDVIVTALDVGMATRTDTAGRYTLASLPAAEARLRFTRDGYEPVEMQGTQQSADAAVQRMIRVAPGDTVTTPRFAPNDLSYKDGGFQCVQCRRVRLVSPRAGTLHLRITWNEPAVTFTFWAVGAEWKGSNVELEAAVPVPAGETIAYLGMVAPRAGPAYHVPVTIEASMP